MNKIQMLILGLCYLVDGLALLLTLGWWHPELAQAWMLKHF